MEYNVDKPNKEELSNYWEIGIGLQKVDDLSPSSYLYELKEKNINNILSNDEIEDLLYKKYEEETEEEKIKRQKECDIVINRITKLLSSKGTIPLTPESFLRTHEYLFSGIYDFAGKYRKVNMTKDEPILNGESVMYGNFLYLKETLEYDFKTERERNYKKLDKHTTINNLTDFTSRIWQVHPFREGNTRTTAVYIEQYLNSLGFSVNNDLFKNYSKYFRNALVRSNYYTDTIHSNNDFLKKFFINLLYGGTFELNNRDLILANNFKKNTLNPEQIKQLKFAESQTEEKGEEPPKLKR